MYNYETFLTKILYQDELHKYGITLTHIQQICFTIILQNVKWLVDYKLLFLWVKLTKGIDIDTIWNDI